MNEDFGLGAICGLMLSVSIFWMLYWIFSMDIDFSGMESEIDISVHFILQYWYIWVIMLAGMWLWLKYCNYLQYCQNAKRDALQNGEEFEQPRFDPFYDIRYAFGWRSKKDKERESELADLMVAFIKSYDELRKK